MYVSVSFLIIVVEAFCETRLYVATERCYNKGTFQVDLPRYSGAF